MFAKNLTSQVARILDKEAKIKKRISTLNGEIEEIKTDIQVQTKRLMEFELEEDAASQNAAKKELQTLRHKLEDTKGLLKVYQDELESYTLTPSEKQKIIEAAKKERDERSSKVQTVYEKIKTIRSQIEQLQEQDKETTNEYYRLTFEDSYLELRELKKILPVIDRRTKKLPQLLINDYLTSWIKGNDTESYFQD